ncbi:ABC transporter permease subunit [Geomicrobium sp. JCM 19038]|uniref:ABC transporter permease subunit n=1 Tax=Geomicrobium sp. JCM 19038 TaxID=1460635 RepID=UPI00045F3320|nr:ABC transporter permease subunit [Geomicrobium sp. JCM 19038]GAK08308.1 alkanesulfonates transport system permease protein [Geomicrobium sp. JCM 19038]
MTNKAIRHHGLKNVYQNSIAPWVLPVILLVVWQVSVSTGAMQLIASPYEVLTTAITYTLSGEIFEHIGVSFFRAAVGFLIGGGLGFILGVLNGMSNSSQRYTDTTIQMFRNIPILAMIPLVIIWFGVGETAKIFLVTAGVMFPVYINTFHGIRSVDRGLLEMSRIYGISKWHLFTKVILPGAMPSILVGVRYALGVMWVTLIVAETIAATSGIGYMSMNAREFMQIDVIILAILLYSVLGKIADTLAKLLEKRLLNWHPTYQNLRNS